MSPANAKSYAKMALENANKQTILFNRGKSSGGGDGYMSAKDKIVSRPYLAKQYARQIESLTKSKVPDIQIKELKNALQAKEFGKVDKATHDKLRKAWKNPERKEALRKQWEQKTGQKWPIYKKKGEIYRGDPLKNDMYYEGHHIIQLNHGGPNEWWNLRPMHPDAHDIIHSKKGMAYEIFTKKIKKD